MPFMQNESLADQRDCLARFEALTGDNEDQDANQKGALRHLEIIERFGRFPHRNNVLGRASIPEEIEFLKEPGSSF